MKFEKTYILSIFTIVIIVFFTCFISTQNVNATNKNFVFCSNHLYYKTISDNELEVYAIDKKYAKKARLYQTLKYKKRAGYPSDDIVLKIPGKVTYKGKEYKVTRISGYYTLCSNMDDIYFLYKLNGMTKLILPDTLKYIDNNSFYYCDYLKKVKFAKKYKGLVFGEDVFGGIYSFGLPSQLKSIKIPEGTYELKYRALGWRIKNIYLPKSLKKIGDNVIQSANNVEIDKSNKYFKMKNGVLYSKDEKILYGTTSSVKKIEISKKTNEIRPYAFYNSNIKTVHIPKQVKKINFETFSGCSELEEVTGAIGVTEICDYAFEYCHKLKKLPKMPKLKMVGDGSFMECESLVVFWPDSVKVSECAFMNPDDYWEEIWYGD